MGTERTIEFHIALNLTGLTPRDHLYWKDSLGRICAELANRYQIQADGWVGSYLGNKPFFLFAGLLDLDKAEDLKKYQEIEAKVLEVITSYIKR